MDWRRPRQIMTGFRVEYDRQAGLREDAKEPQAKLTNLAMWW